MENCYGDGREYREGNRLLDNLQLHQVEWPAVDAAADIVCGNHEAVFQKSKSPGCENDENQGPVGADVHLLKLEVAVPGEGHENV